MSAETPSSPTHVAPSIVRVDLASAAERRASTSQTESSLHKSRHERELRIQFWRLISPGILRPNAIETALASMKVLHAIRNYILRLILPPLWLQVLVTLSGNVLREPDNPKFLHFKPTNNAIKKHLVEVKGALEYAVAVSNYVVDGILVLRTHFVCWLQMGFHSKVCVCGVKHFSLTVSQPFLGRGHAANIRL